MMPQATPVVVVVTNPPTATPESTRTPTPSRTPTPEQFPSETPTVTPTPFPCDQPDGQIIDVTENPSPTAGENLRYRVYLPPCYYQTQRRFPVVYLLHGLSYREQQWEEIGAITALNQGIRDGSLPPMILVMPYFGEIGQLNSFPPDASYETVILDELRPQIERDFCTVNTLDYRAIGGISRGGFWAISLAFRYPEVFGVAGAHSAFFPDVSEVPAEFNPLEIALTSTFLPDAGLRLYLDNGASDSAASSQRALSERLRDTSTRAQGVPHVYVVHPTGGHDNDYWSAHVREYLDFYGEGWPRDFSALPDCADPSP
jgi:S-formylglutathione hydrolase FrmB